MYQLTKWINFKNRLDKLGQTGCLDSALVKCLNSIKNNPDVYTREYGFQESIVENGALVTNDEANIPEALRYANVPLGIVLNNAVEVFYKHDHEDVLQPVRVLYPGDLVGTFEVLDILTSDKQPSNDKSKYGYCLTAGAQSIIPSTTFEKPSQVRAEVKNHIRKSYKPQGKLLHEVLQAAKDRASNWKVEIAFFPIGSITENFRAYLFEHGWNHTRVLRNLAEPDVDKMFGFDHRRIGGRPRVRDHANFLENIARDLYLISHGQLPCFVPVQRNNGCASPHSLLGPFADAYLILSENNPRLEFLVPGYLNGTETFGLYPLSKSYHKTLYVKPELSRACIDLSLYGSRQHMHNLASGPYIQIPILSHSTKVDANIWQGIRYIGSKGSGVPFEGGIDLEKLPFEIGRGVSRSHSPTSPKKPLYSNDAPITGSVLLIKKGILD